MNPFASPVPRTLVLGRYAGGALSFMKPHQFILIAVLAAEIIALGILFGLEARP